MTIGIIVFTVIFAHHHFSPLLLFIIVMTIIDYYWCYSLDAVVHNVSWTLVAALSLGCYALVP